MAYQISADVGGTFTDLVVSDEEGFVSTYKAPTTPGRIVGGIVDSIAIAAAALDMQVGELLARCNKFACGTTVATNAILEGNYAKTGLICTEGFRDTLLIREGAKDDTYTIAVDFPEPYVARELTIGVRERINAEGGIEIALDEESVIEAIEILKKKGVEAVAVCLLWSIANPAHELRIAELLDQHWPEIDYSISHKTNPTIREYRRMSATAIDASLKPLVKRAVSELESELAARGFSGVLTLVTSSGGQTAGAQVMDRPINLCLSGPSAAPVAARNSMQADRMDICNAIVVDMGGTSFDISIVKDWKIPVHREGIIAGNIFGIPSVAIKTIGAGGGSISRVDAGGFIHVGPESARSQPGPACYGRGGMRATVTDANLVRGFLDPHYFAGGTMTLSVENARNAISSHVSEPLGLDVAEAAGLIGMTVEQNMVAAIEDSTIRQGIDPREFIMVAGGAAAGLHVVPIARELEIKRVLVPPAAGVLSAYGILVSDITHGFSRGFPAASDRFDFSGVGAVLQALGNAAAAYLDDMHVPVERREIQYTVQACYRGQVWQLTLPIARGSIADQCALDLIVERFHQLHEHHYFVRSNDPVEFLEWNVLAIGLRPDDPVKHRAGLQRRTEPKADRSVYMRELGGSAEIPVYDFTSITKGKPLLGPAIIEEPLTAIVLYPDSRAVLGENGNIWIDID